MIDNRFDLPETQGDYRLFDLGDHLLECGETLRGARLAYRTFGTVNADKSNAVLVTTWFCKAIHIALHLDLAARHH